MKKKIRSITVDNQKFAWRIVSDYHGDPDKYLDNYLEHFVWLRVWRNGNKQLWASVRCRFNNPWYFYGEILTAPEKASEALQLKPLTPKQVAQIIRQLPEAGGSFSLTDSGMLELHSN
jgi:hypothetical protein